MTIRPYVEADKTKWDGPGSAGADLIRLVVAALGAPAPVAAIAGVFAGLLFAATEPPDAFGSVELTVDGISQGRATLPTVDNEYHPTWRGVEWSGIPINPDSSVRLVLYLEDEDNISDDQIGQVSVTAAEWARAGANEGTPVQVNTSSQGSQNILFVEIEAILER